MPTTSTINFDQFLNVLIYSKVDIFDKESKNLRSPNHLCWIELKKQMNFNISSKYLYLILKQNRHDIFTKFQNTIKVNLAEDRKTVESSEEFSESDDSSSESVKKLKFKITLSRQEWMNIYDSEQIQIYKRSDGKNNHRSYQTLKPLEWSQLINNHFYALNSLFNA